MNGASGFHAMPQQFNDLDVGTKYNISKLADNTSSMVLWDVKKIQRLQRM